MAGTAPLLQTPKLAEPKAAAPAVSAVARAPAMRSPLRSTILSPTAVQAKGFISSPDDAAEHEADRVAAHVVSMPDAAPRAAISSSGAARSVFRSPAIAQRAPLARPAPTKGAANDAQVAGEIKAAATGGFTLSKKTRAFLEPRFRADFSAVRIHTDANAKRLASKIGARAFTYGRHIFFNDGQYDPESKAGLQLLAHELTHTIQQSETVQRKAEAGPRVSERTGKQASRLGISDVLDFFADAANAIPGYRMFTILIGVNPINMSAVEASAANILRAIVEFLPGGNIITRVLDSYGVFDKVGGWIEGQLKSLGITGPAIRAAINQFLDGLGFSDIFDLGGVWERAKRIFTTPITRIIAFAKGLFGKILEFVQEAVLKPLAALAAQTPFYTLLKAVLGKDPVTGEAYEGGASEVIGGFMTMIGQQELWQNIQNANAVSRAFAWFKTAMGGLVSLVTSIPTRFINGLKSLEIMDFVVLPRAFVKIGSVLGSFLADFGSWALGTVIDLLKIIVEVVAPAVLPYIAKAAGAFNKILKDPISFVGNLIKAGKQGFNQFANNFLTHLQASMVSWLTGAMAGANIYIPQGLNLREILKFVLSILGLTWQNIRAMLVEATSETFVSALETGFDIVVTLVRDGPAAAWQKILETLNNLKQMAIDAIMDFVKSRVVEAAVTKLLSMLSPVGAFIQAIIGMYNTIMFFVERLRTIAQVVAGVIDGLDAIANGNTGPAANKVESTMAGLMTLAISFLARIAGLGRVADAVTGLINRVRAPIMRALRSLVNWIVTQARRLGAAAVRGARGAAAAIVNWWRTRQSFQGADGSSHALYFTGEGAAAQLTVASTPMPVPQWLATVRPRIPTPNVQAVNAHNAATTLVNGPLRQAMTVLNSGNASAGPTTANVRGLSGNLTRLSALLAVLAPFDPSATASARVPAETPNLRVTPAFTMGPNLQDAAGSNANRLEYNRQLQLQETGIRAMNVNQWLQNRGAYVARRVNSGRSGRDPAANAAQQAARQAAELQLTARFALPRNDRTVFPNLQRYERVRVGEIFERNGVAGTALLPVGLRSGAVQEIMGSTNALHSPDQVAGGEAAGLTGLGAERINMSIGAQWPSRIASIQSELLRNLATGWSGSTAITLEADRARVRMNVSLGSVA